MDGDTAQTVAEKETVLDRTAAIKQIMNCLALGTLAEPHEAAAARRHAAKLIGVTAEGVALARARDEQSGYLRLAWLSAVVADRNLRPSSRLLGGMLAWDYRPGRWWRGEWRRLVDQLSPRAVGRAKAELTSRQHMVTDEGGGAILPAVEMLMPAGERAPVLHREEEQRRRNERRRHARARGSSIKQWRRLCRDALLERQEGKCGICGESLTANGAEIDHIIPVSRGGEFVTANLQAVHGTCNRHKAASLGVEHREQDD